MEYKNRHDWEMCKTFKFDHTNKWYMHNPAPVQENNAYKLQWDFDIHTDHLISARRPDIIIIKKKKRNCKIVDCDHRIKLKKCEKKDKYFDLARELKKKQLWNMQVTIVIGAFGTVTKGLLQGMEDLEVGGRVETIQTTVLLKTAWILRRVLETWGDLLSLKHQWKTISVSSCEKTIIIIIISGTQCFKQLLIRKTPTEKNGPKKTRNTFIFRAILIKKGKGKEREKFGQIPQDLIFAKDSLTKIKSY